MSTTSNFPTRLSVVDDEEDVAEGLERRLSQQGFNVSRVVPPSASLADTVAEVMRVSDAALCDHHLRGGHKVDFSGAELVAELTAHHFPSVLFTGVLPAERYAIRREMSRIPAFLPREAPGGLGNKRILAALAESVAEVRDGRRPARRRGRRTPVTITSSRVSGKEHLVEVVVAGWPGSDPIEIPADLLAAPWAAAPHRAVGQTFFACVNITEEDVDHVFFAEFENEPAETRRPLFKVSE
jgi:CheY-like chemotaxis protein